MVGPPFPYYSHKNPLKNGNGMGSLWEWGPTIAVPEEIPLKLIPVFVGF